MLTIELPTAFCTSEGKRPGYSWQVTRIIAAGLQSPGRFDQCCFEFPRVLIVTYSIDECQDDKNTAELQKI